MTRRTAPALLQGFGPKASLVSLLIHTGIVAGVLAGLMLATQYWL